MQNLRKEMVKENKDFVVAKCGNPDIKTKLSQIIKII